MAELERVQAAVARAEAELRQASETVRSRDRAVEVTVGHQGELTALRFLEGKYLGMTAGDLAASVLEAAELARTRMSRQVMETFEPFTRPSTGVSELTGVDVDWADIFGPAVTEERSAGPARGGRGGLHDEINDDDPDGDLEEDHRG
ncbi:YbaB/EbfC family nucleoid-associated protein [Streptomyces sp. NPDC090106]|uniref:YbaB/EbfC family nucleoid-associated protein n=1 Tax=Streptomyces sp. NPDC090106 TaxID=3365946 RepID=UPI0037F2C005